jgi:hypothetical protein
MVLPYAAISTIDFQGATVGDEVTGLHSGAARKAGGFHCGLVSRAGFERPGRCRDARAAA